MYNPNQFYIARQYHFNPFISITHMWIYIMCDKWGILILFKLIHIHNAYSSESCDKWEISILFKPIYIHNVYSSESCVIKGNFQYYLNPFISIMHIVLIHVRINENFQYDFNPILFWPIYHHIAYSYESYAINDKFLSDKSQNWLRELFHLCEKCICINKNVRMYRI